MSANSSYLEIQNNVLALISKSDSTTRNRIKNWINMGYYNFVLRELWPFREKTGTLNLIQGTQEYDLSTEFTDIDEQNIISIALQGAQQSKLVYWPFNQLRANEPDFDSAGQAIPTRYYLKAGKLGFWPVPAGAYQALIDYYLVPTELDADSDTPVIPISYREALVKYALSLEHDFNTDPDLAQKAMNEYENIVTLARQNLLSQPSDTGNFRLTGPADAWDWTGLAGEVS